MKPHCVRTWSRVGLREPLPANLTVETIEPPTSVRVTDSDVESLKENWGWRKEKRDRGAIYRWALDHLEDIAIELLRYSSGSRSGYKTLSGKHYVANNGDRFEGFVMTLEGEGKGLCRMVERGRGATDAHLQGDLLWGVALTQGYLDNGTYDPRERAAAWLWAFRRKYETEEYKLERRREAEQETADDLRYRDTLFEMIGGKGWYGTESQLRTLLEARGVEGPLDKLWFLRKLQWWDTSRRAGHLQHRFSVEMRTEYDRFVTNRDGSPRVRKQRFKLVPSGVVLGLEKKFDQFGKGYLVLERKS